MSPMLAWPNKPIKITTKRFLIETLRPQMVNSTILGWMQQPPIAKQFPDLGRQSDIESLRSHFASMASERKCYFLTKVKDSDEAIGFLIAEFGPGRSMTTHHALGDRRWWGKGVVHEARGGFIEGMFRAGVHKVIGIPRASSRSAIQTYKDQGFVQEGILRDRYLNEDGTYEDGIVFGLLQSDWNYKIAIQAR
ncbi:hypothetical protein GV827_23015 [Sulfitobacter sp. JBTF-M27]|uniref:GNAT family N-acetyltransferase n=1 Tax=Sulfitobacter sediminilitoris TaxID=2698830 RepID=A0A6P0CH19_9RHOB|nr:GNAT family protein [Sulfitobacter sediminilitoris]NEK25237.1 hypothetical protein [Sulfitobacter sediminilitoris]